MAGAKPLSRIVLPPETLLPSRIRGAQRFCDANQPKRAEARLNVGLSAGFVVTSKWAPRRPEPICRDTQSRD